MSRIKHGFLTGLTGCIQNEGKTPGYTASGARVLMFAFGEALFPSVARSRCQNVKEHVPDEGTGGINPAAAKVAYYNICVKVDL